MSFLVKGLIIFFLVLILLNICYKVFGISFGLFSVIEGNKGFQKYEEDPMTMANTQKTQIDALKKRVDKNKNYHEQYKKIKTKSDGHTDAIKDLSV